MDKKKLVSLLLFLCINICGFAQVNYKYEPISQKEQDDIANSMFNRDVSNFLVTNAIPVGPVNLTNITNMISYNPIEGTRIRLSAETNSSFSKRLGFSGMLAYGTKDREFKYAVGAAYNFAKKAKGVYAFPASTLSLNYSHNTFMPSYPNYDIAYFSLGEWDRFYFGKKDEVSLSFLQEFKNALAIRPFACYENIYSYVLYDAGYIEEMLSNTNLENYSVGGEVRWTPTSVENNLLNILNSRFYSFPTGISLSYSYNYQKHINENYYNRIYLNLQHRIIFKPMALDIKISAGKIFGESYSYMYFTPNYRVSDVSNMFGFNLYSPYEMRFKEYVQTFTQLNFGGVLLDNIPYIKDFRPNEFINFKSLLTVDYKPYFEAGVGIDHILGFLGVEFVKRFSEENPYDMPEWAFKIRCTL